MYELSTSKFFHYVMGFSKIDKSNNSVFALSNDHLDVFLFKKKTERKMNCQLQTNYIQTRTQSLFMSLGERER